MARRVGSVRAMSDEKAAFMQTMETIIYRLAKRAMDEMRRARHFPARSAGQIRRRKRERAERTAQNHKLAEV